MSSENIKVEETLADLMREVWQGRVFVLSGLFVGALMALAFIMLAVPHNRVQMILAPANPMNLAAATTASQGAGRGGPQAPSHNVAESFTRFEAIYKGSAVAGMLLRDPEITAGLVQDKAFKFSTSQNGWTPEKLAEYISKRVYVDPVGETALREFGYLHPDKEFAIVFLRRLHKITDGLIRHGLRKDVNERIAYLNAAIEETYNPEHRRTITDLLMEQERLKMLVSIDQPYAASVVVPASASVKTSWPNGAFVYAVFMAVGAFLGFVVFSIASMKEGELARMLEGAGVKQQEWFFPESGNNNEKPAGAAKDKPLSGNKSKLIKHRAIKGKNSSPEAAE